MEEILTQMYGMVEGAISDEREICVGVKQGNNTILLSFIPVDYNYDESGFEIIGDNFSFSLSNRDTVLLYDPAEDEYIIISGDTTYSFGII